MVERSDKNGAKGPLYHFDQEANTIVDYWTGTYYLTSHIQVTNGATLVIDGDDSGTGDCKTLLLASDSTITGDDSLNIRAHGGNLVIKYTKIFSWNIAEGTYDTNVDDGRSYISAITEFITGREVDLCDDDPLKDTAGYSTGEAKEDMGVARMDIYNSEIGYLGWDNSESYGVSYKARGLCKTLVNLDIFDDDQPFDYGVYGDIKNSELHHNYFGQYSFGHQGGNWNFNSVHDNIGYGFDPHDDSDHLTIKGNEVYNNGWHGIIASKRCTDISIRLNKVWGNGQNGIMLHRSCDRAEITLNEAWDNGDAGVAVFESSDCEVTRNTLTRNGQGIRLSNGANRNFIHKNDIRHEYSGDDDEGYAVYMYRGNDEPEAEGNENGDVLENEFHRNTVYSERPEAVKIKFAHGNSFLNNVITKGEYASFQASTNNKWTRNTVPDGFYFVSEDDSCFDSNDEDLELC